MVRHLHSLLTPLRHRSVIRLFLEPLAIAIVLAFVVRAAIRVYVIPSASMAPTLIEGDHIIVTPYHFGSKPQPGDVIVFQSPRSADELMVKRVIAAPGDLVETRNGSIVVRGHTVAEPYVAQQASTGAVSPQIIPADSFFVLGDNRADSLDSRNWGVLPRSAVLGRARMILWSSARGVGSRESGVVAAAPSPTPDTRPPTPGRSMRFFKPIP
ncbi:MAG: signal peptidase [Thermoanaerobaculia bacterium]|jgi:signal peptidase I|nr:signal peptidase [Thermoanaerobaculia bacterium]